jgi:hypothetical protein
MKLPPIEFAEASGKLPTTDVGRSGSSSQQADDAWRRRRQEFLMAMHENKMAGDQLPPVEDGGKE